MTDKLNTEIQSDLSTLTKPLEPALQSKFVKEFAKPNTLNQSDVYKKIIFNGFLDDDKNYKGPFKTLS